MVIRSRTTHITGHEQRAVTKTASRSHCTSCIFRTRCLPADLSDAELARFEFKIGQPYLIRAGHSVVRQGDTQHLMYAVRAGSLKAIAHDVDGTERILAFRFPGTIACMADFYEANWAHAFTFVTLENSWLCPIPLHSIDETLRPQLINLMSDRLRREYQSHLVLATYSGPRKVAWFLLELSTWLPLLGRSATDIHLPMSYMDMASYLGMRHESLSRTLTQLQKSGVIYKSGKVLRIMDFEALDQIRTIGATKNQSQ